MDKIQYELKKALFNKKLGISEHRQFEILTAALEIIQKRGFESLQFGDLAKKCKISRPLIHHYYKDKFELANALLDLSTIHLQRYVLAALDKETSPQEKLRTYCKATLDWPIIQRGAATGLLLFIHLCIHNLDMRKRNDQLSALGRKRISQLVADLNLKGDIEFKCSAIQMALTGSLLNLLSENHSEKESLKIRQYCLRVCMLIALS